MLPSFNVVLLNNEIGNTTIKLNDLCKGRIGVIDLWHTKCVKCPSALEKFNKESQKFTSDDNVMFIAGALSLGEGNLDEVSELGPESWENLTHLFIETENKDEAKATFGYSSVPYYIVFDKNGRIIKYGDSKTVDYMKEIKLALFESNQAEEESSHTKDENDVSFINNNIPIPVDDITTKTSLLNIPSSTNENVFKIDEDF